MFFVFSGQCAQVAAPTPNGGVANMKMRVGADAAKEFNSTPYQAIGYENYFGEWEVIYPNPRSSGVRAERATVVYILPTNSFVDIAAKVPQLIAHFRRKAVRREIRRVHRLAKHRSQDVITIEDCAASYIQHARRARIFLRELNRKKSEARRKLRMSLKMSTPTHKGESEESDMTVETLAGAEELPPSSSPPSRIPSGSALMSLSPSKSPSKSAAPAPPVVAKGAKLAESDGNDEMAELRKELARMRVKQDDMLSMLQQLYFMAAQAQVGQENIAATLTS
jgi:hypothetical protein